MFARIPFISRSFFNIQSSFVGTASAQPSSRVAKPLTPSFKQDSTVELDRLFKRIELEYRGHDIAAVCKHLELDIVSIKVFPYIWWIQNTLRAKFAKKKNQLHYETRTHVRHFTIQNITGSTASTFLEYIQRNIPEGVAMKVTYDEIAPLPEFIRNKIKLMQSNDGNDSTRASTMTEEEKIIVETLVKDGNKHSVGEIPTSTEGISSPSDVSNYSTKPNQ